MMPKHTKERKQAFDRTILQLVEGGLIVKYYREFSKIDLGECIAFACEKKSLDCWIYCTNQDYWHVNETNALIKYAAN